MKEKKEKYVNGEKENFLKSEMNEICKNLNKLRKDYEGKWDQFQTEFTLRDFVFTEIMAQILNASGVKSAYQISDVLGDLSVDMSGIPQEGELIEVNKEKNGFRITTKNKKGQIETHFIPLKAVKLAFNWQH